MSEKAGPLTRRDFVRGGMGAVAGLSILPAARGELPPRPARSARVVLVRDEKVLDDSYVVDRTVLAGMVDETVKRVTGQPSAQRAWLSLVRPTEIIGLVPTPHLNPTHDELVEIVRESLERAGVPSENIRKAQGGPSKAVACHALISLPALKAHWLTGMGTVLKNYIAYSGNPSAYHGEDNVKLGEIWNLPSVKGKTRLVLVDALRPLCDKGPQPDPRYLWRYGGLLAGRDPVAVETVALRIITNKRDALRGGPWPLSPPPLCVAAADEVYGLGTSRWEEITVDRVGWEKEVLL